MQLSIGRVEALHTLVVAAGALVLAVVMAIGVDRVYREQALVGDDAKYLSDMRRLEDSGRQLLLMCDLIYGSGVTYLIAGAESQTQLALEILDDLAASPLSTTSQTEVATLYRLMQSNYERLQAAASLNVDTEVEEASRLLSSWDADAATAVDALTLMREQLDSLAGQRADALQGNLARLTTLGAVGVVAYVLLTFAMWLWIRRLLVNPLRQLTEAADRALVDDEPLHIEDEGPVEVRRLTQSTRAFAGQLEARVAERTRDLKLRENELLAEVAERQRAEQLAATARMKAEEASAAKSEFLANMSHEIRTPLNGILGGTELALRLAESDEQKALLSTVVTSGNHLLTVINDVLDFSKLDAGQLGLENQSFSLADVVSDVTRLFAASAAEKGVELVVDTAPDLPAAVIGDGQRVGQILTNLLSNALKFTAEGEVVVRVEVETLDSSRVTVCLAVADTGVGIPRDKQKQIFDPFRQADGSTTRKWGGTGLGLSICRQFALLMGGSIGVTSEPGAGSEFFCRLTFGLDAQRPGAHLVIDRDWPAPATVRVCVCNAALAEVLRANLEHWGWRVVDTGDAELLVADRESLADEPGAYGHTLELKTVNQNAGHAERTDWITLNRPLLPAEVYAALHARLRREAPLPVDAVAETPCLAKRVLVVEDNKTNQLIARKMLQALGCEVAVANDGLAGVEIFQAEPFDVVLMDWHMPGMDGLEATRVIRAWEAEQARARTPIVALTANAMEGDDAACIQAGMDGYLAKPVNVAALERVLGGF